jgi:hypothetical protein
MWLAVAGPDVRRAQAAMEAAWLDQFDEAGRRSANVVIDLDSDLRTCPACLTEYSKGPPSCPSCGLFIGA